MLCFLNGEYLPLSAAKISPLDRGFLFGDGIYEVIPFYNHQAFLLNEHLTRLQRSLSAIGITSPFNDAGWARVFNKISQAHDQADHAIYCQVTRGAADTRQHHFTDDLKPTVFVMPTTLKLLSAQEKQQGLAANTAQDNRWSDCYIKSINLLPNILSYTRGLNQGMFETILLHNGDVMEGTSSNVFVVKNNQLFTPPKTADILWGITRGFVLQIAEHLNIPVAEQTITEAELAHADEIWLTSSGREIVPVTRLNGHPVGQGKVGPLWQQFDAQYQQAKSLQQSHSASNGDI